MTRGNGRQKKVHQGIESDDSSSTVSLDPAPITPEVSIIVPVYNGELYLADCIDSILNQSFTDFEVIFVDDGSSDNSVSLIERKSICDTRIKLFKQPSNQGAPAARNLGIHVARGSYFMFVDADDMLSDNALEALVDIAENFGSDAVKGTMVVKTGNSQSLEPHRLNQKLAHTDTRLAECQEIQHLYQYQSYLLRSEIIHSNAIEFDLELKNFQDPVFLAEVLPKCQRIDISTTPVYVRRIRNHSITTSRWDIDNYLSLVNGVTKAYEVLLKQNQTGAAKGIAQTFVHWRSKLDEMPVSLSKAECLQVFNGIAAFSKTSIHEISAFSLLNAGTHHSLKLISEGKLEEAYRKLESRSRLKQVTGNSLLKIFDLGGYCLSKLQK